MPVAGPSTVSDYFLDWSSWLDTGETITASVWTVPTGITQTTPAPSFTAEQTKIWLTGGTIGESYVILNTITTSTGRQTAKTFTLTITDPLAQPGDLYCTIGEARAAGAIGDDDMVMAAILRAQDRVNRFCQDRFTPRVMTVVARVNGDGRAFLPYRLTSTAGVTSVTDADAVDVTYAVGTWRAYSSSEPGEVDAIGLGRDHVGTNILIHGLEPWAPRSQYRGRIRVTALFGWQTPPAGVEYATAHLAALIARAVRPDDDNNPTTPPPETAYVADPEGNVLPVVPPFTDDGDQELGEDPSAMRTTGSRKADALLIPFRNTTVLAGV